MKSLAAKGDGSGIQEVVTEAILQYQSVVRPLANDAAESLPRCVGEGESCWWRPLTGVLCMSGRSGGRWQSTAATKQRERRGNFVCAFRFASAAISFALELQEHLLQVNWGPELLELTVEQQTLEGVTVFRGLRTSVGMCSGDALRAQPSLRTGRIEYFGPLMNHAARVGMSAHGGQVKPAAV